MTDAETEHTRLESVIANGRVVKFFETTDKEIIGVIWAVYGAIDTNEIIVAARAGDVVAYGSAPSLLIAPPMVDRRFGIDVADSDVAERLSIELWEAHGAKLVKAASSSNQ